MSRPNSYKEALAWLYSLQLFGIKLGLETTERLIRDHVALASSRWDTGGKPVPQIIHVAGTNGKGSVCAMIESIARAAGRRTGLFTSPHLVTFRERIRRNGEMISPDAVATGLLEIYDLIRDWEPIPTFFEVTTALALKYFSNERADVIVLETGMGGRLDSTNAVESEVAVITPIGLDHQKWLGGTLREIAAEKAGIIKRGQPVIAAAQLPEARAVIEARAKDCGAPLQFVETPYEQSPVGLRGSFQKENAALAVAAIKTAGICANEAAIARGLAGVEWPARFQRWNDRITIDGAHNPAAARVLAQTWREIFGEQRATLVLAVLSDKDVGGIAEALSPIVEFAIFPKIQSARALESSELAKIFSSTTPSLHYSIVPSIGEALIEAEAKPNPILVTGSLHFAGEVLAHLRGEPAAFEECAQ